MDVPLNKRHLDQNTILAVLMEVLASCSSPGCSRSAVSGCIAMVAVCHDVLRSCAARARQDSEGRAFAFGSQPNFFC
jgi:hypothetical protein